MILRVLCIILVLLIIVCFGIGTFLFFFALKRDFKFHMNFEKNTDEGKGDQKAFALFYGSEQMKEEFKQLSEEYEIESDDHLKLKAWLLRNDSHKYMILCHGYTGRHQEMCFNALQYYRKGYNCLTPDARAHGLSEGVYRGMGYLERKDIKKWIDFIIEMDPDAQIVLYGRSMGGATVLMSMCYYHPDNLKCVVEDCGYGSVFDEFAGVIKHDFKLPVFPIMNFASMICKLIGKYSLEETSIYEDLKKNEVPCLFIHGDADTFVPYSFMEKMYDLDAGEKQKLVVHKAAHAMSEIVEPEVYEKTMDGFINKYISV